ncbi:site-specific integrase [Peribacillus frigoritolerans]|uniref:site-specific integrase n=1 Tax=Peribacillus frigoritolerans TaxID=450367 RepID=UPI00207986DE|nr:site-specific integrase [Peribacillus frigoritolerans]MEE3953435.1 site-specific integrase [Peribacillus frigoritolerans]USK63405.1 site-specific integrase [Peribacillus frigoritolerans]
MSVIIETNETLLVDDFNDFGYYLVNIEEEVNGILSEEARTGRMFEGNYDSKEWGFISDTRYTKVYFSFNEIAEPLSFWIKDVEMQIKVIKCWVATLVPKYSIETIKKYFSYLNKFLILSHNLDDNYLEDVQKFLLHKCNDRQRWSNCIAVLNFLDFFDREQHQNYKRELLDIKNDINFKNVIGSVRTLPSGKDILAFSRVIEDYFLRVQKDDRNYFKFYPIYLWWKISNLIPMRPSEFCGIRRDSLFEENNRCYIKLPRLKQKDNRHKIQIVDQISLPLSVYKELQEYRVLTIPFGHSETLISSASIIDLQDSNNYFDKRFTYNNFVSLLGKFYKEIIDEEYQLTYGEKIRPGDTRHFAFLNLMRQGYHPVEIARLGGHTSLQAQYHYHQHMEYWVDVEIVQLMQKFNFFRGNESSEESFNSAANFFDDEFIREKILKPSETGFEEAVDIGICTDPDMYCQVDKCFYCDYWKISQDEYLLRKEELEKEVQNSRSEIDKLLKTLKNLYRVALNESLEHDFSEFNQDFNKDLFYTKSQLDTVLNKTLNFSNNLAKRR